MRLLRTRSAKSSIRELPESRATPSIDDFADLVRSKRMQERSIQIEHDGDDVTVSVAVNPYFGYKFPALIDEIKTKVTKAVSDMAGLQVSSVRVDIRGIEELPAEEPAEETTQDQE